VTDAAPPLKIYRPAATTWWSYGGAFLFALAVVMAEYGVGDVLSPVVLLGVCLGLLVTAYLHFFARQRWVSLYDDRLEIQTALAKLLQDRWGLARARPIVIYYPQIQALRRARGFGGYNFLALLLRDRRPGQRAGYVIPYHGVEDSADLEAELLRRVPPTCELYSVNFLGHRGPFK